MLIIVRADDTKINSEFAHQLAAKLHLPIWTENHVDSAKILAQFSPEHKIQLLSFQKMAAKLENESPEEVRIFYVTGNSGWTEQMLLDNLAQEARVLQIIVGFEIVEWDLEKFIPLPRVANVFRVRNPITPPWGQLDYLMTQILEKPVDLTPSTKPRESSSSVPPFVDWLANE